MTQGFGSGGSGESGRGSSGLAGRLELVRDGLTVARMLAPRDGPAARREILRARGELRIVLRFVAAHRELAPLLAPLLALLLDLGLHLRRLGVPRD